MTLAPPMQRLFDCYGAAGPAVMAMTTLVGGRYDGDGNMTPGQALLIVGRRDVEGRRPHL